MCAIICSLLFSRVNLRNARFHSASRIMLPPSRTISWALAAGAWIEGSFEAFEGQDLYARIHHVPFSCLAVWAFLSLLFLLCVRPSSVDTRFSKLAVAGSLLTLVAFFPLPINTDDRYSGESIERGVRHTKETTDPLDLNLSRFGPKHLTTVLLGIVSRSESLLSAKQ